MWEYFDKYKSWYWEEDDMIISICPMKNSPKFEVTVAFGANVLDFKVVKTLEEGKKWAKKNYIDS